MRILFINTFSEPIVLGGAERSLSLIVKGMRERGHVVRVVSLSDEKLNQNFDARYEDQSKAHTVRYPIRNIYLPNGRTSHGLVKKAIWHAIDTYNPIARCDLSREISEFRPDVVSCHNLSGWSISAWKAAAELSVPIVQVLHDYYLMCLSAMRSRGGTPCENICLRCMLARYPHKCYSQVVSSVVGISDYMVRTFYNAGFFPKAYYQRIYNVSHSYRLGSVCPKYPETLTFGFLGRIAPHKGVETLLKAFARAVLPEGSKLLIAGEGMPEYVDYLKAKFDSCNVDFVGHQDPVEFFSKLSWTIVPSISDEPLGRVVFESLGYGVPVMGSRRGGIPEMIKVGQTGYLFQAGQECELRKLIENAGKGLSILSRKQIIKEASLFFDEERFLTQYENVYLAQL